MCWFKFEKRFHQRTLAVSPHHLPDVLSTTASYSIKVEITEAPIKYECLGDGVCEESLTGQFLSYEDCVASCEQGTSIFEDFSSAENQVVVFPNPSSDAFNVVVYGAIATEIGLYDLSGKRVYHRSGCFEENNEDLHTINIQSLSSGIYMLKVQTMSGSVIKKVAVK